VRPLSLVAARPLGGTALTQSTSAQKAAGYSPQAYLDYVSWEREVKRPDTPLVKGIFERAVADHPTEIDLWDEYLGFLVRPPSPSAVSLTEPDLTRVHLAAQDPREGLEPARRVREGDPQPPDVDLALDRRHACRCASFFISPLCLPRRTRNIDAASVRSQEKLGLGAEEVEALFQRALATGYFAKDMDATVALYHARASYYRREMDRNGASPLSFSRSAPRTSP